MVSTEFFLKTATLTGLFTLVASGWDLYGIQGFYCEDHGT